MEALDAFVDVEHSPVGCQSLLGSVSRPVFVFLAVLIRSFDLSQLLFYVSTASRATCDGQFQQSNATIFRENRNQGRASIFKGLGRARCTWPVVEHTTGDFVRGE